MLLFFITLSGFAAVAQRPNFNFRHLNAAQGLADGVVNAIGQDKYGYVWIGTITGLNRFSGYAVRQFIHDNGDSTSLPAGRVQSIFCDAAGQLWIGFPDGLAAYDDAKGTFTSIPELRGVSIIKMIQSIPHTVLLATNKGLAFFRPADRDHANPVHKIAWPGNDLNALPGSKGPIYDLYSSNDRLYLATDSGLLVMTSDGQPIRRFLSPVKGSGIYLAAVDGRGDCWMTTGDNGSLLIRADTGFRQIKIFEDFQRSVTGEKGDRIIKFLIDRKGQLWFTTVGRGLVTYIGKDHFNAYGNSYVEPYSISANQLTQIFQGRQGYIWIGTEGNGVDYFHPENNLFGTILPDDTLLPQLSSLWSRAYLTDKKGHCWLGLGWGLIETDSAMHTLRYFHNKVDGLHELHTVSIRSLLEGEDGKIWVGTADGVNRFDPASGKMEFLDLKDSLDRAFYWSIFQDSRKIIWFGKARSLSYRDPITKKIHSIAMHPDLNAYINKGVRVIYEDHRHRLWFGMNGFGLIEYDPATHLVRHWKGPGNEKRTLIGNTITSIAEDRQGLMWFSSFDGLCSYDPDLDTFTWFDRKNGLPSLKTSGLMVDSRDRLWIGSTMGLLMLDSTRRTFRAFDLKDGLLTMEFSDMPAYRAPDGRFVYPTLKGFLVFDPAGYVEKHATVNVFPTGFTIAGHAARQHTEDLPQIALRPDENFFSIELTAFNYENPEQTWYAYKLEGFDHDWTYTRDRNANYTNVPGGDYTFRFKASGDPSNWDVPEKTWLLSVGTHFYRTTWFAILCLLAAAFLVYQFYRSRLAHQRRLFTLQNKAQALEKEKVIVRYESLKQQLNPHFLFNYLSSLRILIRTDPGLAGEFLEWMSRIYRYVLKSRDQETVTLKEELDFVSNFIRLQKTRYAEGLVVNIDVSEDDQLYRIAPVTLQNLLENAIKHNSIDAESPLVIEVFVSGSYLVVRNNLQKKESVATSNQLGLKNMVSLYRYLVKRPVEIVEDENYYTIKIPLI